MKNLHKQAVKRSHATTPSVYQLKLHLEAHKKPPLTILYKHYAICSVLLLLTYGE